MALWAAVDLTSRRRRAEALHLTQAFRYTPTQLYQDEPQYHHDHGKGHHHKVLSHRMLKMFEAPIFKNAALGFLLQCHVYSLRSQISMELIYSISAVPTQQSATIVSSHPEDHLKPVPAGWSHYQKVLNFVLVQSVSISSKMRVLWISFLLIGGIFCAPQQAVPEGEPPMWMYLASPSGQAQSPPAYEKPVGQSSGYVGYSGYPQQSSGSGVPQVGQQGATGSSGPYQQTEETWSSSSDTSGEDEPVFTPVEDEDEVYAFKSRSNYNIKRLLFNQFRYTPTQLYQDEPQYHHHHHGKGHHHKA
nr:uncharacterized protein LOC129163485 [Nothobranchius furzeri]